MVTDTQDPFKDYFDFLGFRKLSDQPSRILSSIRKYSGTISIASTIATLIAFTAFSIQPVTVSIAGFAFTPAPLAFIPLIVLLFTAVINFINTQKIKENEIDKKIGNYQVDEQYSQIAQEAKKIEIVTNLDKKGEKLSIVLPISKTQREILEDIEAENRNRILLFTGSYVFGTIIVVSAISQSINAPIILIALLVAILLCIISTLSNLISNSVDHENHTIRKHSSLGLLFPYWSGKGMVVSVVENKLGKRENELISLMKKLLSPLCNSFDSNLKKACNLLDNSLLKPANINIKETLDHLKKIREDIKKDLDWLHAEISEVLNNTKELTKKAHSLDIEGTFSRLENAIKIAEDKIERFEPSRFVGWLQSTTQSNNNEFLSMLKKLKEDTEEEKTELKEQLNVVRNELEEIKKKQAQPSTPDLEANNGNNTNKLLVLENKVKELRDTVRKLELEAEQNKLQQKKEKLEQKKSEQEKTDEWKEKINGKPSEFLYYLLESIKLEEKDNKEKKVEATLRDFDNKVTIYWKDGSQTICHIKKQGDLQIESSATMFTDPNVQAAWEMARGKSL
ncbi:Putative uncharacterized protein [Wolbachia pipientis]|uniref:hypothetical protein n=3 Tax=Wolbachieae TaxID=952 RepID=UPI0005126FE4|nr:MULTISPECIES: hypothetical protein [Wolbachia]MBA8766125.1 aminoacyltransferase [Wolbachia pipientis]QWE34833.1 hypothetical protein WwAu_09960 [Wolbachia endosymbiont of Drosophila simulans]CDR79520.1 ATPase involved in DNA repair [Wolbachia endosymbiont of Drosophila simulans wAu]